jgi:FkbM family methyltransferase
MSDPTPRPEADPTPTEQDAAAALAEAGAHEDLRSALLECLRVAEPVSADPQSFRDRVRWPLVVGLLRGAGYHRVRLESGLVFEVGTESRIEKALLLSRDRHPDHVWEPQTTRLLVELGRDVQAVVVGGAYIGDQALPVAQAMSRANRGGCVLAYEPMPSAFERLQRNIQLNGLQNVRALPFALWDREGAVALEGPSALTSTQEPKPNEPGGSTAVTLDRHLAELGIADVGVIMLDLEGGEERALRGARGRLALPPARAPHVVFEVHRSYVDWSRGLESTAPVRLLESLGYRVFAIRDFQGNVRMSSRPIEVIPVADVYLEGPPHGFNLFATKVPAVVDRLDLRIVRGVSPKLLAHRDPALHQPLDGLPSLFSP